MRRPLSVFCLLTAAMLWVSVLLMPSREPELSSLEGKIITLSAVVEKVERMAGEPGEDGGSCRIFLKETQARQGETRKCRVLLQLAEWEEVPEPGDHVAVRGRFRLFQKATNEGEFDPADYYRSLGIGGRLTNARIYSREAGEGPAAALDRYLFRMKTACGEAIDRCFGSGDAGLMRALLLGERRMADEELLSLYRRGGILHLLVISGMHISLLGTALLLLTKKLRCPPAAYTSLAGAGVLLYGRMAGMTASVFRAVWMFEMRLLAPRLRRTYDLATAASLAAAILLITHPLLVRQSGFLFSFSAVFGLALLSPAMPEKLSFAAIPAATLPVHLWFYYGYAPYGALLTLLFAPFLPVLLASGTAACLLGMILPSVGRAAGLPAHLILLFYRVTAETAERLPGAFLITGRPAAWKIAVYYGIVFLCLYAGRGRGANALREKSVTRQDRVRAARRYALRFLGIAAAAAFLMIHVERGLTVSFLDVGQGDGICIQEGEISILVDGGSSSRQELGENVLLPFLKFKGISRVDLMILTHEDYDHCSGMVEILKQAADPGGIRVGAVALPEIAPLSRGDKYHSIEQMAQDRGIPVCYYSAGDVLRAGKMTMECLHPSPEAYYEDGNEGSGVFLLQREDFSALLTGDLEGAGEEEVVKNLLETGPLKLTVLKAAHHGSAGATGQALLDLVHAEYAVISCGRNNLYGHPAAETVERLEAAGCEILDTRECGEIVFRGENVGREPDLLYNKKNVNKETRNANP